MMHKDIKKHYNQAQIAFFLYHFSKKNAFLTKKLVHKLQKQVIFTIIATLFSRKNAKNRKEKSTYHIKKPQHMQRRMA